MNKSPRKERAQRFNFLCTNLVGYFVNVKTHDGSEYEGILSTMNKKSNNFQLSRSRLVAHPTLLQNKICPLPNKDLLKISFNNLVYLKVLSVNFDFKKSKINRNRNSKFEIDSGISSGRLGQERELQMWKPEDNLNEKQISNPSSLEWNLASSSEEEEGTHGNKAKSRQRKKPLNNRNKNQQWNQFETNKQLFGVNSEYNEEEYTSKLNFNSKKRQKANKIAKEIETENKKNNNNNSQKKKLTEEELFSSVVRNPERGERSTTKKNKPQKKEENKKEKDNGNKKAQENGNGNNGKGKGKEKETETKKKFDQNDYFDGTNKKKTQQARKVTPKKTKLRTKRVVNKKKVFGQNNEKLMSGQAKEQDSNKKKNLGRNDRKKNREFSNKSNYSRNNNQTNVENSRYESNFRYNNNKNNNYTKRFNKANSTKPYNKALFKRETIEKNERLHFKKTNNFRNREKNNREDNYQRVQTKAKRFISKSKTKSQIEKENYAKKQQIFDRDLKQSGKSSVLNSIPKNFRIKDSKNNSRSNNYNNKNKYNKNNNNSHHHNNNRNRNNNNTRNINNSNKKYNNHNNNNNNNNNNHHNNHNNNNNYNGRKKNSFTPPPKNIDSINSSKSRNEKEKMINSNPNKKYSTTNMNIKQKNNYNSRSKNLNNNNYSKTHKNRNNQRNLNSPIQKIGKKKNKKKIEMIKKKLLTIKNVNEYFCTLIETVNCKNTKATSPYFPKRTFSNTHQEQMELNYVPNHQQQYYNNPQDRGMHTNQMNYQPQQQQQLQQQQLQQEIGMQQRQPTYDYQQQFSQQIPMNMGMQTNMGMMSMEGHFHPLYHDPYYGTPMPYHTPFQPMSQQNYEMQQYPQYDPYYEQNPMMMNQYHPQDNNYHPYQGNNMNNNYNNGMNSNYQNEMRTNELQQMQEQNYN
ncbi:ataxin-2 [Anaeramoeba flamelloides]|uniref:Ataxin-2 n=1 Tax=Anaeramoeba flamelloides TaxID=1746091 RepID=A0AAV7ZWD9_9EUKA|nr:ataxin-2 [Anaeramoeba flamelloides]